MLIVRLAPVQNFIAHKAADYLSKELKTKVYIGGFHLSWFLDVVFTDLEVQGQDGKIILKSKRLRADVTKINTEKRKLFISEIAFEDTQTRLVYHVKDSALNLKFIIDYFSPEKPRPEVPKSQQPWELKIKNVKLINNHFIYQDERHLEQNHKGINFSNLEFTHLNADFRNTFVIGDSIIANIKNLSCKERSGFRLDKFVADAIVSSKGINARDFEITTNNSHLVGDLRFDYDSWKSYNDFINDVHITAFFKPTRLDMNDVAYFAHGIAGMDDVFNFSGYIKGKVASFSATDFDLKYGAKTYFSGNIKMTGLPNIDETFMHLNIAQLKTHVYDVQNFKLPGGKSIVLPKEVKQLGNVSITGKFTGFYSDFIANAAFKTDVGNLNTDISMTHDKKSGDIGYNGKIIAQGFNIGRLLAIKKVGKLNVNATVKGKNFSAEKADADINGNITNLEYDGNVINKIDIAGKYHNKKFDGTISSNDEILNFDLKGSIDLTKDATSYNFESTVKNIDLARLKLLKTDSVASFSGKIISNFNGNSLNKLLGNLTIQNVLFVKGEDRLYMKELSVNAIRIDELTKRLTIKNDFFSADFIGNYAIEDFDDYALAILKKYLPSLYNGKIEKTMDIEGGFDYSLKLYNTQPLTKIFMPDLKVDTSTVLRGWFNPGTYDFRFMGTSKAIVYKNYLLNSLNMNGYTEHDVFKVDLQTASVDKAVKKKKKEDATILEKYKLSAIAKNDTVKLITSWGKENGKTFNADIITNLSFSQYPKLALHTEKANIMLNDTLWKGLPDNLVVIDTNKIFIQNVGFRYNNQHVTFNGTVSKDPLDKLNVVFKDFNISNIDVLTVPGGLDVDGIFNGNVSLSSAYKNPKILANLDVAKMYINKEFLGDAEIKTAWDNERSSIDVDMRIVDKSKLIPSYPLKINGKVFIENKKQDNFDLTILIDKLKLAAIQPFVESLFSKVDGATSGALTLKGNFDNPVLEGKLTLQKAQLLMSLLGVTYTIDGDVNFEKNKVILKNLPLQDSIGNTGKIAGMVTHQSFKNFYLNLNLKVNNLSALHTNFNPKEVYYGKALATGDIDIEGGLKNLNINIFATPVKGTQVFIPIRYSIGLARKDFIRYQSDSVDEDDEIFLYDFNEKSAVNLDMLLDVTPNAEINILLPDNLGDIKAHGHGLIDLGINTRGDNKMYGLYVMDDGDFKLNLENIFKRNFRIRSGSTIAFNGSPTDATVNLKAEYKTKTSLAGLPNVPLEITGERVMVNCVVSLQNSLMKPDIRFSIELPNATEEVKQYVFSAIDTTNVNAMNQQMISLLALNSFATTSGILVNEERWGNTSYDILNNQINNFLSQVIKDIDIGVNYRPGSELNQEELGLMFSKKINERLSISGNVGRNTKGVGEQQVSRLIGDFLVEYKITKDGRFILKAFNRTNSLYDINNQAPYTQGVGVLYRKEFDNAGELWKKKKKVK